MRYRHWILLLVLPFVGCTTVDTALPANLPATPEFVYYTDVLANTMWFVLQEHPEQAAVLSGNHGELLQSSCWNDFNKSLGTMAVTPEQRQALQIQAIAETLSKYKK
jgi:hypothetical protein